MFFFFFFFYGAIATTDEPLIYCVILKQPIQVISDGDYMGIVHNITW